MEPTATALPTTTAPPAPDVLDPRRSHRVFWRFFAASSVSSVGDGVTAVALPLLAVERLHASSLQVSAITAAAYLAWLLVGLPAGVLVHRLPLRGTQVVMDLARAGCLLSVPIAWWAGILTVGQLVVVALLVSLATVVFDVGNAVFLPTIVPKEQLVARNSLQSGAHATAQIGGPSLGGLLVQTLGAASALLADIGSYLVSATLLAGVPGAAGRGPAPAAGSMRQQIRDGIRYVMRHPVIGRCVAMATVVNFVCGGLMALTPVFLVRTLGAPAGVVGLLVASEGVGSVVGATLTPRLSRAIGSARALLAACLVAPLLALAMPLAGHGAGLVAFAVGNAGFAAGVVVLSILTRTHRHTVVPPELLPRVMATVRFVSWGAIPFGAVAAGLLAAAGGVRLALAAVVALAWLTPVLLWTSPVRRMRELG